MTDTIECTHKHLPPELQQHRLSRISKESGLPLNAVQSVKAVKCYEVTPRGRGIAYNLFAFQHDQHLTIFARQMRSGITDTGSDYPRVIIAELQFGNTSDCKASVEPNAVSADQEVSKSFNQQVPR